jgi:hypothetical protein
LKYLTHLSLYIPADIADIGPEDVVLPDQLVVLVLQFGHCVPKVPERFPNGFDPRIVLFINPGTRHLYSSIHKYVVFDHKLAIYYPDTLVEEWGYLSSREQRKDLWERAEMQVGVQRRKGGRIPSESLK